MSSPLGDVLNFRTDTHRRSYPADQTVYHTPTPTSASTFIRSQPAPTTPACSTDFITSKLEKLMTERKEIATEQVLLEHNNGPTEYEAAELASQASELDKEISRLETILIRFNRPTTIDNKLHSNTTTVADSNTPYNVHAKAYISPIVPKELPKFGRNGLRKPNEFIFRFEQILGVYELDFNRHWERLLPSCVEQSESTWIENNLCKRHITWHSAKEAFLSHFEHPLRRSQLMQKIWSARPQKGETLREYGDRFLKMVHDASVAHSCQEIQEYFISTPPVSIQNNIQTTRLISKTSGNGDILSLTDYIDMAASFSFLYQPENTFTEQFNSHTASFAQKRSNSPYKIHGANNADNVSAYRPQLQRHHSNTVRNEQRQKYSNNKSFIPTCYICSGSHFANTCKQYLNKLEKTPEQAANSSTPKSVPFRNKKIVVSESETNALSAFMVPIIVENRKYNALLDTGATHSLVDKRLCKDLKFTVTPKQGQVELAIKDMFVDRIGTTVPLSLSCGVISVKHCFEVLVLPKGTDFVIGCDLFSRLGFTLNNVPVDYPLERTKGETLPDEAPSLCIDECSKISYPDIKDGIVAELEANTNIPSESFCNVAESVVTLQTPENATSWRRQYPLNPVYQHLVDEAITKWLKQGIITFAPVNTSFNNAITLAPKKDANGDRTLKRPCLDPRPLNKLLPDDRYPLPLIQDIFKSLAGSTIFTTLDLEDAYHKFRIHEGDQHKTAFTWKNRQYMFIGAPFGLKPLASKFQRVMHIILQNLDYVQVFVDDVIIFSSSPKAHLSHIKEVISRLTTANLKLNVNKCRFGVSEVVILGFHVSTKGITIDPKKVSNVHEWPVPTTGKQVMSYLGFCNYFRDRIPLMSTLTAPLDKLRTYKRIEPKDWTTSCQESFETLKSILTKAPILQYPDFNRPFFVATDASDGGIGAVLYQETSNIQHNTNKSSDKQFISFIARSLQPAGRNYSATRRELLGIVFALQKFRQYLWTQKFTLLTDHKALTYLHTQKELSPMLVNWLDIILDFNFTVVHCPGILNILPDCLSRLYPPAIWGEVPAFTNNAESIIKSRIAQVDQTELTIPVESDRLALLSNKHALGHFGAEAIVQAVHEDGKAWPNIKKEAVEVVKACQECQRFNIVKHGFHPLSPISANLPGDHYAMDFAGPFTTSINSNHYLFVMVDVFTRFVFLRAIPDKQMLTIAATCVSIFSDFGYPKIMQSDNGAEFVNQLISEITKASGIDHRLTTPYHPRANGLAERFVQSAVKAIKKRVQGVKANWDKSISAIQLSLNLKVAAIHKTSPFIAMFARKHNDFKDYSSEVLAPLSTEDFNKRLQYIQDIVYPALSKSSNNTKDKMKKNHKHFTVSDPFPIGSLVMTRDPIQRSKLDPLYEGPYKIIRRTKGGTYVLEDNTGALLSRNFAPSTLKLISCDTPNISESFEVESIINHRQRNNMTEYLVKWKHYDNRENTWEPTTNFDSPEAIHKYWERRGS